jgi:hypothetical protein
MLKLQKKTKLFIDKNKIRIEIHLVPGFLFLFGDNILQYFKKSFTFDK